MYKDLITNFNGEKKNVCIDVYIDKPFMLLARMTEKRIISVIDDRLVIRKADRLKTVILNIPVNEINDVNIIHLENLTEYVIKVKNIYYKITLM